MARRLIVLVLALLLTAQIVRNSAVAALVDRDPDLAARAWPGHPAVEISVAMTEIGRAARERRPPPAGVFAMVDDAARKAPLASEPFLVRGVQAQLLGNAALATEAFAAAAQRDPRSLPGHYFLADALFRSGDTGRGLREIGLLARLAPGGVTSLAPYVAAYAKDRQTWPQLRKLFRSEPVLQDATLTALAADPANVGTILSLADARHPEPNPAWLPALVNSLVVARQYETAHRVWAETTHARSAANTLYDRDFVEPTAPPPFNWVLMSSTVGLAERMPRGGLHVIFYGREDGILARQLLVLPAGAYRISIDIAGNAADAHALTWSIRCDGSQTPIAATPLDGAGTAPWRFAVPAGCPAQWLELSGVATDVAHQVEAVIRKLELVAERPNG